MKSVRKSMRRKNDASGRARDEVNAAISAEHAAIMRTIASIPRGRVASYGEIAMRAGLPRRARLVGRVLGDAGSAAKLPWQRVLRSDGRIAFPRGSKGFREQRARLLEEGVVVHNGRVDLQRFGWQRNLDAEIWAPLVIPEPHAARTAKRSPRAPRRG